MLKINRKLEIGHFIKTLLVKNLDLDINLQFIYASREVRLVELKCPSTLVTSLY